MHIIKNSLLVITSLVVALLLGEAMLRVLGYDPAFVNPLNSFHRGDPDLGWVGVPNFTARFQKPEFDVQIESNAQGFRKQDSAVTARTGANKIFFLGDSFTWGWGVNNGELFTDRLQTLLGENYDVQNYGVNAYGSVQELILLERLIAQNKIPDRLFIMLFRNDFADNLDSKRGGRPYYGLENGRAQLRNSPVENPLGSWSKTLRRHSYVLTFLSYWANYFQAARDQEALQAEVISVEKSQVSVSENSYAAMRAALKNFQRLSKKHAIALTVVYIPDTEHFDRTAPYRQAVTHLCEGLDIDFIDLTLPFSDRPEKYHFPQDEHWTVAGHALAATLLHKHIEDKPVQLDQ